MSMGSRICLPKNPKWLSRVTIVRVLNRLNNTQKPIMDAGQWWESFLVSSPMPSLETSSSVSSDDWSNFHRNFSCIFRASVLFRTTTFWNLLMENSLLEILTYYVIGGALLVGAPGIFFLIVFMPALQNTKGRMVGYKDHKTYGDSSIYENTPGDSAKYYLELSRWYIRSR